MLTGNLVRARVRKGEIRPSFVKTGDASLVETAEALVALWRQGLSDGWTRARLDESLDDIVGNRKDHLVIRGLAKLCADRSEFASQPPVEPVALRREVFAAARLKGPLALEAGPLERPTAAEVLAEVGARHGLTGAEVADALYADLREAQRLTSFDVPDGDWLLQRYNVALAQALLLRCDSMRVVLKKPSAPRMQQLFRYAKFFQLICAAERSGGELRLTIDGPTSLFRQSTRYGMQLANFLPALLLQDGEWSVEATVQWTQRRLEKTLKLDSGDGLVSHYRDVGAWRSKPVTYFEERFAERKSAWTLGEGSAPISLGGRSVLWPDFTLTRADGAEVHLEIVGFWRRDWLERRLELLRKWGPGNLIIAVSKRLQGGKEALADFDGVVIPFAEVLSPKKVADAADELAQR